MNYKKIQAFVLLTCSGLASATSINDLYEKGLSNSLILKSAKSTYDAGQEQKSLGLAGLLPTVNLTGVWGDQRRKNMPTRNGLLTVTPRLREQTNTLGYEFTVNQPLYNMTAYRQFELSHDRVGQSTLVLQGEHQDYTVDFFAAYVNVVLAWQRIKNVEEALSAYENQKVFINKRFKVGLARPSDIQQAESALAVLKADNILAKNDLGNAFRNLELIVQQPITEIRDLTEGLQSAFLVDISLADAMQGYSDNNDFKIAVSEMNIAQQQIKISESRRHPTVSASLSYQDNHFDSTFNYQRENQIFQEGLSVSLQVQIPLYRGGRASALTDEAAHNFQRAKYMKQYTQQQVQQSIRASYLNMRALLASINARKESIDATITALANSSDEYLIGIGQYTDVLNSQVRLYDERNRVVNERVTYLNSYMQFNRLIGKLSDANIKKIEKLFTGDLIANIGDQ